VRLFVAFVAGFFAIALAFAAARDAVAQETQPARSPSGDEPQPAATSPATPTAAPAIEGSELETYLLRDSKGNLVPVLDLPFEEFERLLRIKRGLAPALPPAYSLDALTIVGSVEKEVADLQVTATIRVRESGLVRVPLALGKTVLRQPPKHEGPGEHFFTHDENDGYLCWLRGAESQPHIITFHISAKVDVGEQSRLSLRLPRATESSLRLSVPLPRAEVELPRGDGIASTRADGEERSELTVLGPAGELELVWQRGRGGATALAASLESSAEITVKVEGENRVSSDVRLRLRRFGGALETVRVRLPPGMELIPTSAPGYTISVVDPGNATGKRGPPPAIVEIKFDRPVTGVAEARLVTAQSADAGSGPLLPARFEVLSAVRQRGTIDFVVEGDWQLTWKEDATVRRLDVPADAASAKIAARYEFSRQPCALSLGVATRPSRLAVEPVHVVFVDDQQIRLESTLKYRLRGARADGLRFALGDWQLDRLSPGDLFDIPTPASNGEGTQLVPFRAGAALPAEIEVKLEAHRPYDPANEELSFALPRPLADVVTPATVMVVAADNVELTPLPARLNGLSLDPAPNVARIGTRQQMPLVYRELATDQAALFAANVRVRTRWTTASARAQVTLSEEQIEVQQQLDYRIAYERRRLFDILVPRAVLAAGTLQVSWADESLSPIAVENAPLVADALRFQVATPSDQIGLCQIVVRYSLPLPTWDRQKPLSLQIPLVIPADEPHQQPGGQQLEFVTSESWRIEPDPEGSDEFSRPTPTTPGGQRSFAWSRVAPKSRWIVQAPAGASTSSATLSKVWIQTWLSTTARQDRFVLRCNTDRDELRFRLPTSPIAGSVQAAINGRAATTLIRAPATVVVPLPATARGRENAIELWYGLERTPAPLAWQNLNLRPPALEGASAPQRLYWQFCLPAGEHLVTSSADFAVQSPWQLFPGLDQARAALSQQQLESWIGASRQEPLPAGSGWHSFSMLGSPPILELAVVSRRVLVAVCSALALAIGLVVMHVRWARRPEALLAAVVVLVAVSFLWPQAALLAGQAAVIGLVIALAVAAWQWVVWGRTVRGAPTPSSSAIPIEVRSTEVRSPEGLSSRHDRRAGPSTATAPVSGPAAEPVP
jgi:hypothetical protein